MNEALESRTKVAGSMIAALFASLFLQAGATCLFGGHRLTGFGLLVLGSAILIGRLISSGILSKASVRKLAVAILIVALGIGFFTLRSSKGGLGDLYAPEPGTHAGSAGEYRGVILWTEAKTPTVPVAPRPALNRGFSQTKQLLIIPFDGVYWFYKFPDREPPKNSYSAHGSPASTAFRSSDSTPLEMEARQNFVNLLNINCCSRIAVEITNADRYLGTVSLELILTNLQLPGQPGQSLGKLPVTSIPQRVTESELRPTREVLSFAVPTDSTIQQFDSATVKFIRYGKRGTRSARIAVERFTLVPRGLY